MEITEVRVKLVKNGKNDKLRAFCSITIDNDFVIRDLKVIDGIKGPFVAMPSRKLMERCEKCSAKNHYRAKHCNECGSRLSRQGNRRNESEGAEEDGRSKLHTEIAHPINSRCREVIQNRVLSEYRRELDVHGGTDSAAHADDADGFDDYFQEAERAVHTSTSDPEGRKPAFDDPTLDRRVGSDAQASNDGGDRFKDGGPNKSKEQRTVRRPDFEDAPSSLDEEPEDNFGAGIFP